MGLETGLDTACDTEFDTELDTGLDRERETDPGAGPAADLETVRESWESREIQESGRQEARAHPAGEESSCGCGGGHGPEEPAAPRRPGYVYALGRVQVRFPSLGVEKEFAQSVGRADTAGLTDRQALHAVLSRPENRYLVRQLCFVLTIEGMETYLLKPRYPDDYDRLVEAIRPTPKSGDLDVVIGRRGHIAPADDCNGLMIPVVHFEQIYSFDTDELVGALQKPDGMPEEQFESAARELLDRIMQMADNAGMEDGHRVLNYLITRYADIYTKAVEYFARDYSLSGIDIRPSRLSGARTIVDVIFSFTHRRTDVTEKQFVRTDATEMLLFIVTKLSPYFDRPHI
ncbi:cyanobactin maturation protease PatG family protein [Streptomyces litchfieldiae]|uniref:PatG domain-containing protein n=1 Tax=Streptomyces litchfieldiae TaxID=3075543 RepID=A0ABU2MSK6_9ACTN|nr:hypothetical protein [Streptomyces sp. DSM 44938]MDT0344515.1 hypothetical protein [Streptomyces sp. DSM 44938]